MKWTGFLILVAVMVLTIAPVAQAQVSIRDLQRNLGIYLVGEVRSVSGNKFILDDGTGQIMVDAGPSWYQPIDIAVGEKVKVVGKYDDFEFDAYSIIRRDGEVIQIRPAGGPPPWIEIRHGRKGKPREE
jgi:hypothetical protein